MREEHKMIKRIGEGEEVEGEEGKGKEDMEFEEIDRAIRKKGKVAEEDIELIYWRSNGTRKSVSKK